MVDTRQTVHCWADGPEEIIAVAGEEPWWQRLQVVGSTCLLPDGHPGEHEWTSDQEIAIEFSAAESP